MTLEEFLLSQHRNAWINEPGITVYVRKGLHVLNGRACYCLGVANIEVDEDKRHQGIFKAWLKKAERMNPWEATFIESVLNPVLHDFLDREGYTLERHCLGARNYFKRCCLHIT